jgi:hypothetical protein
MKLIIKSLCKWMSTVWSSSLQELCKHDNELSGSINGGALLELFNAWPFAEIITVSALW